MSRLRGVALAGLLGGCGSLTPNADGVAILEILAPRCNGIELGHTIQISAQPLDQHGAPVDAPVRWRTPDITTIAVDSVTGRITGLLVSDTARVQARSGTQAAIVSDFIALVVTPAADTLARTGAARVTVGPNTTGSAALSVLLSKKSPATPIKSFPLVYRVVEPVFSSFDDRTVELAGGGLTTTVCSSGSGTPLSPPILSRRPGKTAPDSAIVEVTAQHPDGGGVAGSGQRFTVVFLKP